jgi:pyruvate dehydrogenase E2 component (dihydrolipoamide acetyltransferase)
MPKPAKSGLPPLATPHTRKLARELGVDLNLVKGSGPSGRITEEDVRGFSEGKGAPPTPFPVTPAAAPGAVPTGKDFEKFGPVERVPLKGVRRKISENMLLAQQQTVMVTHMDEVDVGNLQKIHREKAEFAKEKGVKLTLLPFLMKACAIALRDHPSLNASLSGEEVVFKKYYHFGFAVDTEAGLMVPVIRNVDKKSILHLASELAELSKKTRERKVQVEEFHGHSFSITNIGSIGGKAFTPIINYPDSAILGMGRTYEKPVVKEGEVGIAPILPLCLTFDHRVTDGATAARFINQIIGYLQDPDLLLLEDGED